MELEEIIEEIFLQLPMKSLTRCKCLSKKWNHFISNDTFFRQTYLSRLTSASSPLMLGFFLYREKFLRHKNDDDGRFLPACTEGAKLRAGPLSSPSNEFLSFLSRKRIFTVGSSNGFLLCCVEDKCPMSYYICNPITKEWIPLPKPNKPTQDLATGFTCQGDYPCLNLVCYKVVRAVRQKARTFTRRLTFEVFSSESMEWKVFKRTCPSSFLLDLSCHSVIINEDGVVYLLVTTQTLSPGVIVFDERKKDLKLIAMPENHGFSSSYCFGQSNGHILYVKLHVRELEIWVLEKMKDGYTKKWLLKHQVTLTTANYPWGGSLRTLTFHPLKFGIFLSLGLGGEKIVWYDGEDSTMELVYDISQQGRQRNHSYRFFAYEWPNWPILPI